MSTFRGKMCLFVISLNLEDHFFLEATQCHSPEYLTNYSRGLLFAGFFLNSDNLVLRLLKLIENKAQNLSLGGDDCSPSPKPSSVRVPRQA